MNNVASLKFPDDLETQLELAQELEDCFNNPEKIFTKRFQVLLEYFIMNGDRTMKTLCEEWKNAILSS
jgi:hypothetical protein